MDFDNILYTPLDTVPVPDFDVDRLFAWIEHNYAGQEKFRRMNRRFTSDTGEVTYYPWNNTFPYYNILDKGPGWLNDFDKEFPALVDFFSNCFGIPIEDIGFIQMLPMKRDAVGAGFYHQDYDLHGLRIYLEFEDSVSNCLYIRRTKIPYDKQSLLQAPVDLDNLQKEEIRVSMPSNRFCWYINNIRSCHSTYVGAPGKKRISVIVASKFNTAHKIFPRLKDLVLKSAEKYPNHVIVWKPEQG